MKLMAFLTVFYLISFRFSFTFFLYICVSSAIFTDEFRSKVACENDNMPLVCNPYSRIAIYSASFGYIERESVQCPHNNTQNAPDTNAKQSKYYFMILTMNLYIYVCMFGNTLTHTHTYKYCN